MLAWWISIPVLGRGISRLATGRHGISGMGWGIHGCICGGIGWIEDMV